MPTRTFGISGDLTLRSAGFEAGARSARQSMKSLTQDIQRDVMGIRGSIDSATAALGGFGKGLLAGAAGAVGITGVTSVITRMIQETREAEDAQAKLAAVLRATGYTAGLTARQLGTFADELEGSTLQSAEAIKDASSVLLTFRSVASEVFIDAISRAADLSAVFKQDLSASATQLGKALESPVEGISALRRVGVSFTDAQKEVIAKLVETGRVAEAQKVILKTLADQVGGAAEAQRSGTLSGAFFGAADAIGDMLKRWDQITGTAPAVISALKAVERFAGSAFAVPDTAAQVAAQREKIQHLQAQVQREQEGLFKSPAEQQVRLELEAAQRELEFLEERLRREQQVETALQRRAKASAEAAQAEVNAANVVAAAEEKAQAARTTPPRSNIANLDAERRAREAATNALRQQVEEMTRLRQAQGIGQQALHAEELLIEAEAQARAGGVDLMSREGQIRLGLAQTVQKLRAEIEDTTKAREAEWRAIERTIDAQDEWYRRNGGLIEGLFDAPPAQQQIAAQRDAWSEATDRLQGSVADAIQDGLRDGFDAQSIIDGFGQVLTATVSESIAASLFEGLDVKGALGTKLADKGITAFGTDATFGQAGAAALGAGFSGYAIGQTAGSRPIGLIGGAVSGAAAGSVLGPYGAIAGGIIGGAAGFIGGGAGGGERNNNFIAGYDSLTGRPVEFQNTRPDQANVSNVNTVVSQLDMLRDGLRGLNIAVGETELTLQSGNRSGLTLNGESFSSLGGLTEAALDKLLTAADLTAEQKRVAAASNATDAQGLLSDLGFIDEFKQLAGTMSALDAQTKALEVQFGTARDRAQELGFTQAELAALTRAESQAQRELQQQAGRDRGNILDFAQVYLGDAAASLRTALRNQATQFDQLREQLKALGGTAEQMTELNRDEAEARAYLIRTTREQAQAAREQARQSFQAHGQGLLGQVQSTFGFLDSLRGARDSLATSDLAPGTTLDQYQAARAQFQQTRQLALAGNLDAINALSGQGQQLLLLSRQVNASGAGYGRDFASVQSVLDRIIGQNEAREDKLIKALEKLGVGEVTTIQQQTRTLQQELRMLVDEARKLTEALKGMKFEGMTRRNAA